MRLAITHETRYHYSPQVQTAQHVAHLQPADTPCQKVMSHWMQVDPSATVQHNIDAFLNHRAYWALTNPHEGLSVRAYTEVETRAIHLAFAVFLSYMAYPAFRRSPRAYVPVTDWVFALVGTFCAAYLFLFYKELATRPGQPTPMDVYTGAVGIVLLLEATRRVLGLPMVIVALVFLGYTFGGPYMPDMIAHRGFSLNRAMSHQWLTTEGVFGVALGVSSGFIFLFVLFGSLLDKAGAGNYFIKSAFALLGHMRGGPAKAAVLSSAATGIISGSSIANVVTTGQFTIPLMKRFGYRPAFAGGVEATPAALHMVGDGLHGGGIDQVLEWLGHPTRINRRLADP